MSLTTQKGFFMDHIINLIKTNPETTLDRPLEVIAPQVSYFELITSRLEAWEAKKQAIKEQKAQLTKSFILTDEDPIDGQTRVYQTSITLLRTFNNEGVNALELPELALSESEANSYVS